MDEIKVLVADPSRLSAEALAMALWWTREFEVVIDFPATGGETVDLITQISPQIALVDYFMPEMDAPGIIHNIAQKQIATKVIVLSLFPSRMQVTSSLDSGAVGFLPKSSEIVQVVEAVRRAHSGESPVFADKLEKLISNLEAREQQDLHIKERMSILTPRELTLLQMLSQGLSNSVIAKRLKISPATVKRHFYNVIVKTEARTKEEALAMADAAGLIRK